MSDQGPDSNAADSTPAKDIPDGSNLTLEQVDQLEVGDPIRKGDDILEVIQIEFGPFLTLSESVILFASPQGRDSSAWLFSVE